MNLETLYEKMEYGPAPESPNNAEQWLKDHQHKFSLFINGKWTEPSKNPRNLVQLLNHSLLFLLYNYHHFLKGLCQK